MNPLSKYLQRNTALRSYGMRLVIPKHFGPEETYAYFNKKLRDMIRYCKLSSNPWHRYPKECNRLLEVRKL